MRAIHSFVRILYLENHAIFAQQVMSQFLKSHRVTVVPSLAGARHALASEGFDLVLCDYDLDDGKGDEFVRESRAAPPRLPIIAVSSHEVGNAVLMSAGASAVSANAECRMRNAERKRVIEPLINADSR
jgi:CheY-like chemotaxis protein